MAYSLDYVKRKSPYLPRSSVGSPHRTRKSCVGPRRAAALTAACSPHHNKSTRPREMLRAVVYALKDPAWHQSYKDLVDHIRRASSCLARIQRELQQYSSNILFDLVDIEVLKDVNLTGTGMVRSTASLL